VTFSACKKNADTEISPAEMNDSLKKIATYYDKKGMEFYDQDQLDSAVSNYMTALTYYEQTDEIKNRR